jgi:hypothetical protein
MKTLHRTIREPGSVLTFDTGFPGIPVQAEQDTVHGSDKPGLLFRLGPRHQRFGGWGSSACFNSIANCPYRPPQN